MKKCCHLTEFVDAEHPYFRAPPSLYLRIHISSAIIQEIYLEPNKRQLPIHTLVMFLFCVDRSLEGCTAVVVWLLPTVS